MSDRPQSRREEPAGLSSARSDFALSLPRRVQSIREAIAAVEQEQSAARRDNLLRRVHALSASARVLGFAALAESLSRAEQRLRTSLPDTLAEDLAQVQGQLNGLEALLHRSASGLPVALGRDRRSSSPPALHGPLCVLVLGAPQAAAALRAENTTGTELELVETADVELARELAATHGPDVVVLDGSLAKSVETARTLSSLPESAGAAVVVVSADESFIPALLEAGARVALPQEATNAQIWRAVAQCHQAGREPLPARDPLGNVTVRDLADQLAEEIRRGLAGSVQGEHADQVVALGDGTDIRAAAWAALARIRELVVTRSEGRVKFSDGPEGSVLMAPGVERAERGASASATALVDLKGRKVVVVDDDPAVAWFVGGTMRVAGAEVHEVHDGARALDLVYRIWPDLVVSDVLMPGLDGFALCREIKRDVAVRDVPVVLISWKEDLLFRLRELGADADAYLRKEASASTIVQRTKELLWPRVSLERRLATGSEVRGRLDGWTTRLVVELVCQTRRRKRIIVRDASSLYDVRVRDGALRALTRTANSGGVQLRGETALERLLGASAGRFSVTDDDEPYADDFAGKLEEVLTAPILRARAAQRLLSSPRLSEVDRVIIDPSVFNEELPALPPSLRPLVDELARGTPLRRLLGSATVSGQLVESFLADVARRGAVRTISGSGGVDLLAREILSLTAPPAPSSSPRPATPPLFSFQLSPAPPQVEPGSDAPQSTAAGPSSPVLASAAEPKAPERPVPLDTGTPTPSVASVQASAPTRSETSGAQDREATVAAPVLGALSPPLQEQPSPRGPVSMAPSTDDLGWIAEASWDDVPVSASAPPSSNRSSRSRPSLSAQWGSETGTRPGMGEAAVRVLSTSTATGAEEPQSIGDFADAIAAALGQSTPPPPAAPTGDLARASKAAESGGSQRSLRASAAPTVPVQGPIPAASSSAPTQEPDVVFPLVPTPASPVRPRSDSDAPDSGEVGTLDRSSEPLPRAPDQAAPMAVRTPVALPESKVSGLSSSTPLPANPAMDLETVEGQKNAAEHEQERISKEQQGQGPADQVVETPAGPSGSPDGNHAEASASSEAAVTAEQAASIATEEAASAPQGDEKPSRRDRTIAVLKPLGLASAAAVVSFALVTPLARWWKGSHVSVRDAKTATSAAAAVTLEANASSAVPSAARAHDQPAELIDIDVPEGVTLPPGKAMLEIVTGGGHAIFVDDHFVGRGPVRLVPLDPGRHVVRTRIGGEERVDAVELQQGRSARLALDKAWR